MASKPCYIVYIGIGAFFAFHFRFNLSDTDKASHSYVSTCKLVRNMRIFELFFKAMKFSFLAYKVVYNSG